ncbi:serine/threonine-protein kinase CDG1-like isoform X3 [Diospyros lotus]|uniref:serine/threonine-protein kinase CDG1-like isoform X3 n=1 Tax=Diospyros lotus TaxID=55363 RepID=UPI00224FC337|nr:serine/threonine-protein kinase CDG1-like isoform X3 [Diospyros lotus]
MANNYLMPCRVVLAHDATKERSERELKISLNSVRAEKILREGDTLMLLGVLHKVPHPMGYQMQASPISITGTNIAAIKDEISRKVDMYVNMLAQSAKECETEKVEIEVKITAGTPIKNVVIQEVKNYNPTWVILDRSYSASLNSIESSDGLKNNLAPLFMSISHEQSSSSDKLATTSKLEKSAGRKFEGKTIYPTSPPMILKQQKYPSWQHASDAPVICTGCGLKTELYIKDSMQLSFSEIQVATNDFSGQNLLGEGGYGFVYKGKLKNGQVIAAKVRKEASAQGFPEFHSEVHVLRFARHQNIVMLLGYCCKENLNILVYEYICNKSLDWHLFDDTENVLEWQQRHGIAIGTAKGLRYLHEECRGSPIIHRDMRPSNILLTHDFVPMLGDFGLAKWKTNDVPIRTRILGTFGYLAPEYAENGIVSPQTDVYSYGIVLIQLISGRRVVDSKREDQKQSLRQWAEPLIERLALHQLVDPRIGDSYDTYELYLMAKTAYLCVQSNPELRPSMGEVVRLLEGENDHFQNLAEQFIPHFSK